MSEAMSEATIWRLRCEQLEEALERSKADALKWRRSNQKNLDRNREIYRDWENHDRKVMEMLDRIVNPIKTFEQAQVAAQDVIDYLKTENSFE